MTETEWLAGNDYWGALWHPPFKPDVRKLRLFCAGCARRFWPDLHDDRSRAAVEVFERFVEGGASERELLHAEVEAAEAFRHLRGVSISEGLNWEYDSRPRGAEAVVSLVAEGRQIAGAAASETAGSIANSFREVGGPDALFCDLLRDIFGHVFRAVIFSPEWRTDTTVSLARQMYESRDFSAMPILADALQDAGCDSDDILSHCRGPKATHVRGCWVVDLVLGKE